MRRTLNRRSVSGTNNKRRLYESIMRDVSKTVKKHLNENVSKFYIYETYSEAWDEDSINNYNELQDVVSSKQEAKEFIKNRKIALLLEAFSDWMYEFDPDEQDIELDDIDIDFDKNNANNWSDDEKIKFMLKYYYDSIGVYEEKLSLTNNKLYIGSDEILYTWRIRQK